ncbi:hypothetical protein RRG08_023952 [Elysia crispata]|uniref:Uncharacterized protein n=1 Tax=Elysia crispata TaxID=231223 RepID=A0AAE0YMU0_9GAST|nr:hypothetical protein RRG08_023952 [Elysia crispata]
MSKFARNNIGKGYTDCKGSFDMNTADCCKNRHSAIWISGWLFQHKEIRQVAGPWSAVRSNRIDFVCHSWWMLVMVVLGGAFDVCVCVVGREGGEGDEDRVLTDIRFTTPPPLSSTTLQTVLRTNHTPVNPCVGTHKLERGRGRLEVILTSGQWRSNLAVTAAWQAHAGPKNQPGQQCNVASLVAGQKR